MEVTVRGYNVMKMMIYLLSETGRLLSDNEIPVKDAEKINKLANKVTSMINKKDEPFLELCDRIEDEDISREDAIVLLSEHFKIKL